MCLTSGEVVHHLGFDNKSENVILLCNKCHTAIHASDEKLKFWNNYFLEKKLLSNRYIAPFDVSYDKVINILPSVDQ